MANSRTPKSGSFPVRCEQMAHRPENASAPVVLSPGELKANLYRVRGSKDTGQHLAQRWTWPGCAWTGRGSDGRTSANGSRSSSRCCMAPAAIRNWLQTWPCRVEWFRVVSCCGDRRRWACGAVTMTNGMLRWGWQTECRIEGGGKAPLVYHSSWRTTAPWQRGVDLCSTSPNADRGILINHFSGA